MFLAGLSSTTSNSSPSASGSYLRHYAIWRYATKRNMAIQENPFVFGEIIDDANFVNRKSRTSWTSSSVQLDGRFVLQCLLSKVLLQFR